MVEKSGSVVVVNVSGGGSGMYMAINNMEGGFVSSLEMIVSILSMLGVGMSINCML